jgi:hypothetical protein
MWISTPWKNAILFKLNQVTELCVLDTNQITQTALGYALQVIQQLGQLNRGYLR